MVSVSRQYAPVSFAQLLKSSAIRKHVNSFGNVLSLVDRIEFALYLVQPLAVLACFERESHRRQEADKEASKPAEGAH